MEITRLRAAETDNGIQGRANANLSPGFGPTSTQRQAGHAECEIDTDLASESERLQ